MGLNGPGFKGLSAGDLVEFRTAGRPGDGVLRTARVLKLLVFADHVVVNHTSCGWVVNAQNYVRTVRTHQRTRWEVVHQIGNHWENVSHEGGRPLTFATRQEARDDMREHFANMRVADMAFCETQWKVRKVQTRYHQES